MTANPHAALIRALAQLHGAPREFGAAVLALAREGAPPYAA